MRDVHYPLRAMAVRLLSPLGITVYEEGAVPDTALTPYVTVGTIDGSEASNKCDFGHSVIFGFDVVTSFLKTSASGSKQADEIAGKILGVINSKTSIDLGPGLELATIELVQDKKINMNSDTSRIFRRLIQFKTLIMEV